MDLKELYKNMHKEGLFSGFSTLDFKDEIRNVCKKYQVCTMLDYGCGKGFQYKTFNPLDYWNLKKLYLYDIGVETYEKKPNEKFDMVITIDVLEHIHPNEIDNIIAEIDNYTNKVVFASIATVPARKKFPDGTNVHLIVKPKKWWEDKIKSIVKKDWYCYFRTENTKKGNINTYEKSEILNSKK